MINQELVIRSIVEGRIFELIPVHAFIDDLPHAFAHEYFHWLDIAAGTIEWRSCHEPWTHSRDHWHLRQDSAGVQMLTQGSLRLLAVNSPVTKAVSAILRPLEFRTYIQTILHDSGEVEIRLPRMKLHFSLFWSNDKLEIISKQFRGMRVDRNQSFGAWTGLENKLIFVHEHQSSRMVIVPSGKICFSCDKIMYPSLSIPVLHLISIFITI